MTSNGRPAWHRNVCQMRTFVQVMLLGAAFHACGGVTELNVEDDRSVAGSYRLHSISTDFPKGPQSDFPVVVHDFGSLSGIRIETGVLLLRGNGTYVRADTFMTWHTEGRFTPNERRVWGEWLQVDSGTYSASPGSITFLSSRFHYADTASISATTITRETEYDGSRAPWCGYNFYGDRHILVYRR